MINKNHIFNLLDNIPFTSKNEIFNTIISNDNIKIERIISYGQTTPKDYWYNQEEDEFVLILKGDAKIQYDDGSIHILNTNDSLYIQSHQKHKVTYTANPTIWLAIFFLS